MWYLLEDLGLGAKGFGMKNRNPVVFLGARFEELLGLLSGDVLGGSGLGDHPEPTVSGTLQVDG